MKKAVIFGVNGQDGSYLSELLLEKGYSVIGVYRRSSVDNLGRITDHEHLQMIEGDITDFNSVENILLTAKPDEVYNLAAQSHVGTSFNQPIYTTEVDYIGVLNILEVLRNHLPSTRFYQASTSEMFGTSVGNNMMQDENTVFQPCSPYAIAKMAAHHAVSTYRRAYGLHANSGILFNHESPRRGENFVTRKITKWYGKFNKTLKAQIKLSNMREAWLDDFTFDGDFIECEIIGFKFPKLRLGNLFAYRDWGHAKDYVKAMWLMLQQETPDDYVIATGKTHAVVDFLIEAIGPDWKNYVIVDPAFYRPSEVEYLCGNPAKAKAKLGWEPETTFAQLVKEMVQADSE